MANSSKPHRSSNRRVTDQSGGDIGEAEDWGRTFFYRPVQYELGTGEGEHHG